MALILSYQIIQQWWGFVCLFHNTFLSLDERPPLILAAAPFYWGVIPNTVISKAMGIT